MPGWPAIALAAALAAPACTRVHPARLVWEGAGPARAQEATARAAGLAPSASELRRGTWGESPDATFQLIETSAAERPHVHDRHDLTVLILRGRGTLVVAGRDHELEAGDVVHVARGRVHHFHPAEAEPVLALAIFTPRLEEPDSRQVAD